MIEQRQEQISVEAMCEVLEVSPSGYYASRGVDIKSAKSIGSVLQKTFLL